MDALVGIYPEAAVIVEPSLEREFEQRLAESSTLAFRIALGVLHHHEDAEDVAQEAFVKAYKNFHRLRDRERFRAWLARIAWRLALDRVRSVRRRQARELAAAAPQRSPTVEDVAASREFQAHLERAMDELPKKLRVVMVLAAVEGYEMEEVSRLLGVSQGTVKSRLFWARKKLAEELRWLASDTKTG